MEGAAKRNLTFRSTTNSANIALHGWTCSSRSSFSADFAKSLVRHQLMAIIGSADMKRVDLYIKIELELDEEETAERVAGEICRQLEKLYSVRRAEVSNAVARD